MTTSEFKGFPKIPRFGKFFAAITEKIDGTNAGVFIGEDGSVLAASRKRWITPSNDNYGFAAWVEEHAEELPTLGPGMHWGEWWGRNIQRGYDLTERRFSLFDVFRWGDWPHRAGQIFPSCCHIVPLLGVLSVLSTHELRLALQRLGDDGSTAAPGYMKPEGIVIYTNFGGYRSKMTFDNMHKGAQKT